MNTGGVAGVPPRALQPARRPLFVATILAGSFLLFLVQPMVARMALPALGGAPNVWNSAMLVYQALLLGGYAYAHALGRLSLRRQALVHLGLLAIAGMTLPIALADLPPPAPGSEAWWVPLLFLASVGPVFFLVSAQAPLMQRWFAANPSAGAPWALYAASNLGSFAGLLAYPLLVEPLLRLHDQSVAWAVGYGLLVLLVAVSARARWDQPAAAAPPATPVDREPLSVRRIALWLVLSAVPSGLMLSTTTHLTTDVFAMPLLWVIPLGLYLLSFVFAFSDSRKVAGTLALAAPAIMLLAGGLAMSSRSSGTLMEVVASVALLFAVAVTLHARFYDLRPDSSRLTLFYLVMSAGGALGGLFTALLAPMMFDWAWEHPVLVLAAALLMPLPPLFDWRRMRGLDPEMARVATVVLVAVAAVLAWRLLDVAATTETGLERSLLPLGLSLIGLLLVHSRALFVAVLVMLMLAHGGAETISTTLQAARTRSYFGIYTVRDYPDRQLRTLAHGTTLHGQGSTDPARVREPMTYYGPDSGVGLALRQAPLLYGPQARVGIVGLGTGTLACYRVPGQIWRFYEIDPAVLAFSRDGTFTFLSACAPEAEVVLGDARLELAKAAPAAFDILAIDAFSSDAIPLHLLTTEAVAVYLRTLSTRGVLLIHISNRYIELEPVLAAIARHHRLSAAVRDDNPADRSVLTPSSWVALSRDPAVLKALAARQPDAAWKPLAPPAAAAWTDDHASILPFIRWSNLLRKE